MFNRHKILEQDVAPNTQSLLVVAATVDFVTFWEGHVILIFLVWECRRSHCPNPCFTNLHPNNGLLFFLRTFLLTLLNLKIKLLSLGNALYFILDPFYEFEFEACLLLIMCFPLK